MKSPGIGIVPHLTREELSLDLERIHEESFKPWLALGRQVEEWIAVLFLRAGLCVRIGRFDAAKTPYESARFRNEKDVLVSERHIIEVKGNTRAWTSIKDHPYRDRGIFTCTVARWERRQQKPLAFVLVSRPTGTIFVVRSRTFSEWHIENAPDRRPGREGLITPTYCAPMYCVEPFARLVQLLVDEEEAA
jgi:hypothetical protein